MSNLGQVVPNSFGKRSTEIIGEQIGESYKQIQRYIRLTNLVPDLLNRVDNKRLPVLLYFENKMSVRIRYSAGEAGHDLRRGGFRSERANV